MPARDKLSAAMRKLLLLIVAVPLLCFAACAGSVGRLPIVVGTYTGTGSEGVYVTSFDGDNGRLAAPLLLVEAGNPSFVVPSADGQRVYCVGEDQGGSVSAYRWRDDGRLELQNSAPSLGRHPCHVDARDGLLAVANYSTGDGAVYALAEDGAIAMRVGRFEHRGSGPVVERQQGPHAHQVRFSPDGRFLYVVDLGIDQVVVYPVTRDGVGEGRTALQLQPGDGPRHLDFHPQRDLAVVVNELSNSVVCASIDPSDGTMTTLGRCSTLPEGFTEHSQCADIHFSPDGRFVYASNRGHDSIAVLAVRDGGALEFVGATDTRGDWPRNFTLSPDGRWLLVANQRSDNITVFARDASTGALRYTGHELRLAQPVCLRFLPGS